MRLESGVLQHVCTAHPRGDSAHPPNPCGTYTGPHIPSAAYIGYASPPGTPRRMPAKPACTPGACARTKPCPSSGAFTCSANIDNPNPPLSYTGSSQERRTVLALGARLGASPGATDLRGGSRAPPPAPQKASPHGQRVGWVQYAPTRRSRSVSYVSPFGTFWFSDAQAVSLVGLRPPPRFWWVGHTQLFFLRLRRLRSASRLCHGCADAGRSSAAPCSSRHPASYSGDACWWVARAA